MKLASITDHKRENLIIVLLGYGSLIGAGIMMHLALDNVHETLKQTIADSSKLINNFDFKIVTGLLMLSMMCLMMLYSKIITNYVIKRHYNVKPYFTWQNIAWGIVAVFGLYGVCAATDLPYFYDNAFMGTSLMISVFTATRLIRKAGEMYGNQQKQAKNH